jgi:queuine tRNA-ribosyltransferase catalytic subunit
MFMPVGTKGCLKALTYDEWTTDPALSFPIVLANTYHLALQPGTDLLREFNGLHAFQGRGAGDGGDDDVEDEEVLDESGSDAETNQRPSHERRVPYNLLTDSGGFQMVSLAKLSVVTEQGVSFENPFRTTKSAATQRNDPTTPTTGSGSSGGSDMMLLTPEDSIRHQNNIGANIIMALDDVVSSVACDPTRFQVATHRTLRWYDRCYHAHSNKATQNLFPIVQGGLDSSLGGLREQCLAGFRHRQLTLRYITPGYAIGGLAGGESKDEFWKVVDQCCKALPDDKPRYLMGVGYPLDLVVCTALGVDMYDCVYPTRTARFGVCLVAGKAPGTLRLKAREFASDDRVIEDGCRCQACREKVGRSRLHNLLKSGNPVAVELVTQHNLAHMMRLVRSMRQAILRDEFGEYARNFVRRQYPGKDNGGDDPPGWVVDALATTGIHLSQ